MNGSKKNLKKFANLTTRVSLVQNLLTTKEIPVSVGAELLDINRTSVYYKGKPVSEEELACKEIIDHLHTDTPSWGARQMSAQLKARGYNISRRRARRCLTAVIDWNSRCIVGWEVDNTLDARMVINALKKLSKWQNPRSLNLTRDASLQASSTWTL